MAHFQRFLATQTPQTLCDICGQPLEQAAPLTCFAPHADWEAVLHELRTQYNARAGRPFSPIFQSQLE